ncbi:pantetheine-phosphate adenylyltransferase [Secundilactobacillus malefermentans]|uniref:Phosphopantetheine adenylyltransferase n=1 Tax=Secundilactobacillus malefermentans TaxID=176292 RepID=A0A4R5NKE9_9LACO|nr:pantetheine-phosphate adenylyltransferase [Secundilactobacillus malefermentans]QEA30827.1 pantetheine-phosphate adenylyltransferase [Secundilactobacillus malefermentans]TDG75146.1 hypothetical protein C5L31_001023 [Secundilactobacillus malefermentans]
MTIAVYPGSFDPITNGHLNIIKRASQIFDEVVVVVGTNTSKKSLFSSEQRLSFIKDSTKGLPNVTARIETGLTVTFLKSINAKIIIRGIRDNTDFEFEKKIAGMNQYLDSNVETLFMVADSKYDFVASSLLKEVAHFNGNLSDLVPPIVASALEAGEPNEK